MPSPLLVALLQAVGGYQRRGDVLQWRLCEGARPHGPTPAFLGWCVGEGDRPGWAERDGCFGLEGLVFPGRGTGPWRGPVVANWGPRGRARAARPRGGVPADGGGLWTPLPLPVKPAAAPASAHACAHAGRPASPVGISMSLSSANLLFSILVPCPFFVVSLHASFRSSPSLSPFPLPSAQLVIGLLPLKNTSTP
eukprot:361221-Chlamydomonas_euryale.AAC.5